MLKLTQIIIEVVKEKFRKNCETRGKVNAVGK